MIKFEKIANELSSCLLRVSEEERAAFSSHFTRERRVFCAGAGRSGLVARAFAMRLAHLGLTSYMVGETITPSIREGDILMIVSGSGSTPTMLEIGRKAKDIRAQVLLITSKPESALGGIADASVTIPFFSSIQPLGTLSDQSALIVLDAIIVDLMGRFEITDSDMRINHANLE